MDNVTGKSGSISMQDAMKLAKSDAGKKIFAALQNSHGQQIQDAMNHAQTGDIEQAKKALSAMLASEEVQSLIKSLGG